MHPSKVDPYSVSFGQNESKVLTVLEDVRQLAILRPGPVGSFRNSRICHGTTTEIALEIKVSTGAQ